MEESKSRDIENDEEGTENKERSNVIDNTKTKGKILFLAEMPCIRTWKYAKVLQKHGYEIYLGQDMDTLGNIFRLPKTPFKEVFTMTSLSAFNFMLDYFDIIHCHNEPDMWSAFSCILTKNSQTAVIHDCHDFVSARDSQNISHDYLIVEKVANCFSDYAFYVSKYQEKFAHIQMAGNNAPSAVVYNAPLEEFIPKDGDLLPKLKHGKKDKKIKLVYAGGVNANPGTHRHLYPQFEEMLRAGFELYVYCPFLPKEYSKLRGYAGFHDMGHCDYDKLMVEISQYDIGLIPFHPNRNNAVHLASGMPNKLFEYLSAGLPIAVNHPLEESAEFTLDEKVGFTYLNAENLMATVKNAGLKNFKIDRFKYTFDKEIEEKVIPVYEERMARRRYRIIKPQKMLKQSGLRNDNMLFGEYEDGSKVMYDEKEYPAVIYGKKNHKHDILFESFMKEEEMAGFFDVNFEQAEEKKENQEEELKRQEELISEWRKERRDHIRDLIKRGFGKIPNREKEIIVSGAVLLGEMEEKTIENCITSIYDLCDEIVVINTKPSKNQESVDILLNYPKCLIIDYPHADEPWDFSKARNFAQIQCKGKWILVQDADEELRTDPWMMKQEVMKCDDNAVFIIHQLQMLENGTIYGHLGQHRIYPNKPEFRWESREHNQLKFPGGYEIKDAQNRWENFHWGHSDPRKEKERLERTKRHAETLFIEVRTAGYIEDGSEQFIDETVEKTFNLMKMANFVKRTEELDEILDFGLSNFKQLPHGLQMKHQRFLLQYVNTCILMGWYDKPLQEVFDLYYNLAGETVDGCFFAFCYHYRNGNMISAFAYGLKYWELQQIESEINPLAMQITLSFSADVMQKLEYIKYYMNNHFDLEK